MRVGGRIKRIPAKQLLRDVEHGECKCSWCGYPIVKYSPIYRLAVGGVPLGPAFCMDRCGFVEAQVNNRGPVVVAYKGDLYGAT